MESTQRLTDVRVLPGGEVVAVEKPRQGSAQPFRREASALRREVGSVKHLLRDFEIERLRDDPTQGAGSSYRGFTDAASTSQSFAPLSTSASLGNLTSHGSPVIGYEELQAGAFANFPLRASSPYSLNEASGLRITKRRPPSRGALALSASIPAKGGTPMGTSVPSNRSEAIRLGVLLDTLLEIESGGWEQQCDAYDSAFAEAALQVANHCVERGELLQRIRKFYRVVVREERDAREAARRARAEAHDAHRAEREAAERAKRLEAELSLANQKLEALRAGMVRLKMLRAIHMKKLGHAEVTINDLQREIDRLREAAAEAEESAGRERDAQQLIKRGSGPGGSSEAGGAGGGAPRMARRGSTSGVDMLAAQMEALRAALAEKDAQLAHYKSETINAQAELRASDQEVNALMAGISSSATTTRNLHQSSSAVARQAQNNASSIQGQMVGMSSELGQLQGDTERQQHLLDQSEQDTQRLDIENDTLRQENLKLKAQLRWTRAALGSSKGGAGGFSAIAGGKAGGGGGGGSICAICGSGGGGSGGADGASASADGEGSSNSSGKRDGNGNGDGDASGTSSSGRKKTKGGSRSGDGNGDDGGGGGGGGKKRGSKGGKSSNALGDGSDDDGFDGGDNDGNGGGGGHRGKNSNSQGSQSKSGRSKRSESDRVDVDGGGKDGDSDDYGDSSGRAGTTTGSAPNLGGRMRFAKPRKRIITSLKGGKAVPKWMALKLAGTMMQAGIEHEKEQKEKNGDVDMLRQDFGEFVEDRFVEMYGVGKVANDHLRDFIKGLKQASERHLRLKVFRVLTGIVPGDDQANLSVTDSAATFYRLALSFMMETASADHMSNLKGVTFWTHFSKADVIKLPVLYFERVLEKLALTVKKLHGDVEQSKTQAERTWTAKQEVDAIRFQKAFELCLKDHADGNLPSSPDLPGKDESPAKVFVFGDANSGRATASGGKALPPICIDCFLQRAIEHWSHFEDLEEAQVLTAFGSWDENGDGQLELMEFSTMIKYGNPTVSQRKMTRAFVASAGGGDFVDKTRLAAVLLSLGLVLVERPPGPVVLSGTPDETLTKAALVTNVLNSLGPEALETNSEEELLRMESATNSLAK